MILKRRFGNCLLVVFTGLLAFSTGLQVWGFFQSQRAFVYVDHVVWVPGSDGDQTVWTFIPVWLNSGDTPTRFLDIESYCPVGEKITDYYQYGNLGPYGNVRTAGPKQTVYGISCVVSIAHLLKVQKHDEDFYWTARATYRDVFNPFQTHVTEYCMHIAGIFGDLNVADERQLKFSIGPCPRHNCADGECE